MASDAELEERIRALLVDEPSLTEKRMFGGLGFLVDGKLALAASERGVMVRSDPDEGAELIASGEAEAMVMRGRQMTGWLRLDSGRVADDTHLEPWVRRGVSYARSLPPKK